ncbi:MAG: hypothetical protein CMK59_00850 [Proteobacteria bacterium]|nr:hypothetical protein [Pseudomonadota bacterium]
MRAWKKAPFTLAPPSRHATPPILELGWDDSASIETPGSYELYRMRATQLNRSVLKQADFINQDNQFLKSYKHVPLCDMPEIETLALPPNPIHTYRSPRSCITVLSDRLLANICEDLVPDVGLYALQRVFGPLEHTPPSKELAGAVLSFCPLLPYHKTPLGQLSTENRKFTKAMRLSISAMATTPAALWKINKKQNTISPLIPIKKEFIPEHFKIKSCPPEAKMLVARIFKTEHGWQAGTGLFLPYIDTQYVLDRLKREWLRFFRVSAKLTWEDLLCYRSELLYRSCIFWCFKNAKKHIKHITYWRIE